MATRRDIIDAFYDTLETGAVGTYTVEFDDGSTETLGITAGEVDLYSPEYSEMVPGVFYSNQADRHVEFNGVGNGPDKVGLNTDGTVDYVQWTEYVESLFYVYVRAQTPAHMDPVYESVHREFGKYTRGRWNEADIHPDIIDVSVDDVIPASSLDQEDAIWGSQLEITILFKRRFIVESGGSITMEEAVESVENIAQVNLETDADLDDDTVGFSYTIT